MPITSTDIYPLARCLHACIPPELCRLTGGYLDLAEVN
jgi:hypothetical protein